MLPLSSSSDSRFAQTLSTRKAATPVWLWPNLLSLDAPLVALPWAFLFAHSEHETLSWSVAAILAGAVWTIYVADRLLDARRHGTANLRQRHLFARDNRNALLLILIPASALTFFAAIRTLSAVQLTAGVFLAAAVLIYMLTIHSNSIARHAFPKEFVVGVLFASGVTLPIWTTSPHDIPRLAISAALFAALCALNCLAIETWETTAAAHSQPQTRWLETHFILASTSLAILACAAEFLPATLRPNSELTVAIASAAILTLLLHLTRTVNPPPVLRVLADVALFIAALVALTLPALLRV